LVVWEVIVKLPGTAGGGVGGSTVIAMLCVAVSDPLVPVIVIVPAPRVALDDAVTCTLVEDVAVAVSGFASNDRLTPAGAE
jgi:hypothetical protein